MTRKKRAPDLCVHEKLLQYGPGQLADVELLSLVLRIKPVAANQLLEELGSLRQLEQAGIQELCSVQGIGPKRASLLKAVLALGRRLQTIPLKRGYSFTSSEDVFQAYAPRLSGLEEETFWVLLLDQRNRLIKEVSVGQGSLNRCPITTQSVFGAAMREKALRMILIHNHPSGNSEPSQDDKSLTTRLEQAAKLLGLEILDHVVIGGDSYVSFADRGWI